LSQAMSKPALTKLRAADWPAVLPRLALAEPAAGIATKAPDAVAALEALVQAGLVSEATKLLAFALPKRESVWWACMCARHTMPPDLPEPDRLALEAAEKWVFKGEEAMRRAAFAHAETAKFSSAEAWAAVGAFWSGDSMAPAGQAAVPPAPHLSGTAVSGSILLAAVRGQPARRPARLARFVASGREIADGGSGRIMAEDS